MKKIYKNDKYLRGLYRENKQWKISVWFAILGFSGWKYQNEIFCKVTLGIWLSCKESACNAEDAGSIPGSGRSHNPWVRKIPWRRAWQPTHSSILAWRIPWTEEPAGLQSMGSQRVRHDWATNTHFFFFQTLGERVMSICAFSVLATLLGSGWAHDLTRLRRRESLGFARTESCGCTLSFAAPCVVMVWGWGQSCRMDPEPGPIQGNQDQGAKPSNVRRALHEAMPEVGPFCGFFPPTWVNTFFKQSSSASLHLTENRIRLRGRKLSDLAKVAWSDWGSISVFWPQCWASYSPLHDLEGAALGKAEPCWHSRAWQAGIVLASGQSTLLPVFSVYRRLLFKAPHLLLQITITNLLCGRSKGDRSNEGNRCSPTLDTNECPAARGQANHAGLCDLTGGVTWHLTGGFFFFFHFNSV